jgi:CheY-like chemotaxis protein/HPt (histidine-containing phosphotransfer) domain-containing protein
VSLKFLKNASLRRDWLVVAQALWALGAVLLLTAWQLYTPQKGLTRAEQSMQELPQTISAKLERATAQLAGSLGAEPLDTNAVESGGTLLNDVERVAWQLANNAAVASIEFRSVESFLRLERGSGSSRILWQRAERGQPLRRYLQSAFGERATPLVALNDSEPKSALTSQQISAVPADSWTPVGVDFSANALWVKLVRRLEVRTGASKPVAGENSDLSAGSRGLLSVYAQLIDGPAIGGAVPLVGDKPPPVWLRDDVRGALWPLHEPGAAIAMNAAALPNLPSGLEWKSLNLPWVKASVGFAAPDGGSGHAATSWVLYSVLISGFLCLLLGGMAYYLRARFESDARQLAGILTFSDAERRNLLPNHFESREFYTLAGVVKRQAQIAITAAHKAYLLSTEAESQRRAQTASLKEHKRQDPSFTDSESNPPSTFGIDVTQVVDLEGGSGQALVDEKTLRDAYAAARQWQTSYHKLRGRTQAELTAKNTLVEQISRDRRELEGDYLSALGELDSVKASLKKAQSREPVAVSFKSLQILLLEDNPLARKLFENALAKLRYRADMVGNAADAIKALDQVRYQAIIVGSSISEEGAANVIAHALVMQGLELGKRPYILWLERNSSVQEAEHAARGKADELLHTPLVLSELQEALDRADRVEHDLMPNTQFVSFTRSSDHASAQNTVVGGATSSSAANSPTLAAPEPLLNDAVMEQHRQLDNNAPEPFMRDVIEQFAIGIDDTITKVNRYAATQQWEQLARCVHKLRGTSLTLGAQPLERLCKQLESAGDDERADEVIALLEAFEACAKASSRALIKAAQTFKLVPEYAPLDLDN